MCAWVVVGCLVELIGCVCFFSTSNYTQLVGWLVGWLVGDWLVGDWLVGWFCGCLLAGWSVLCFFLLILIPVVVISTTDNVINVL